MKRSCDKREKNISDKKEYNLQWFQVSKEHGVCRENREFNETNR